MATVLNYCAEKISGDWICGWDDFMPEASPSSSYVLTGNPYEADVFLANYVHNDDIIRVRVGGSDLPVENGVAHYRINTSGAGYKDFLVEIFGTRVGANRDGFKRDTFRVAKKFSYYVATRHPRVPQPDNLQYLYFKTVYELFKLEKRCSKM